MFETAIQTFTSPVVLFFVLGLAAAFMRSDLTIPEPIAKAMSLYLMAAIGIKGGVAVAKSGIDGTVISALGAGIAAGFILPFFAYGVFSKDVLFRLHDPLIHFPCLQYLSFSPLLRLPNGSIHVRVV